MANKKVNTISKEITLILDSGLKCVLQYRLDEEEDDYILDRIIEEWENSSLFYTEEYCELYTKIRGEYVNQVDMRKVVAINYQ